MKFAIMCGGEYKNFDIPKPLVEIKGEKLIERTIRLLKELGVQDIVITSNNPIFDNFGVLRIENKENTFSQDSSWTNMQGWWLDGFYRFNEPTCYLFGDVYYSERAIQEVVYDYDKNFIFVGSDPQRNEGYTLKPWEEPLAFMVFNYNNFYDAIDEVKKLYLEGKVKRHPIAWEVYRYLCGYDVNERKLEDHFVCINDYSCDVDCMEDIDTISYYVEKDQGIEHKKLSKVFGVISYLPTKEPDRSQRIERLNRMFNQIHDIFGNVNWIVIAQNWKNYKQPNFIPSTSIHKEEPLGILKARKYLRNVFLSSSYDYLIMCDDDVIIETLQPNSGEFYMESIDRHPNGFMFLQYQAAQLNMCAISKDIYNKEPMVDIDPQLDDGFEDTVFSNLLHYKYPSKEFKCNSLKCIQFNNKNEVAPSTWSNTRHNYGRMSKVTNYFIERFKKGDFSIDKSKAKQYALKKEWCDMALRENWIKEDEVKELMNKYE